jgi:hypothetical protein
MPADTAHHQPQQRYGDDDKIGTVRELGGQHDEQDKGGQAAAHRVDRPGTVDAVARGLVPLGGQGTVPVPHHAELRQG